MDILVVIDMQNDFIDGALGTPEAEAIVPNVVDRVKNFNGLVLATRDTHGGDYLQTQEGRMLPVEHCIRGTYGWEIREEIAELLESGPIDKPTFGSETLGKVLKEFNKSETIDTGRALHRYLCDFQCHAVESIFAGGTDHGRFSLLRRSDAGEP